jgi:hypothetical protein
MVICLPPTRMSILLCFDPVSSGMVGSGSMQPPKGFRLFGSEDVNIRFESLYRLLLRFEESAEGLDWIGVEVFIQLLLEQRDRNREIGVCKKLRRYRCGFNSQDSLFCRHHVVLSIFARRACWTGGFGCWLQTAPRRDRTFRGAGLGLIPADDQLTARPVGRSDRFARLRDLDGSQKQPNFCLGFLPPGRPGAPADDGGFHQARRKWAGVPTQASVGARRSSPVRAASMTRRSSCRVVLADCCLRSFRAVASALLGKYSRLRLEFALRIARSIF